MARFLHPWFLAVCPQVVGSPQELGAWNVAAAPVMEWQEGNIWALNLSPAPPAPFEFKVGVQEVMRNHQLTAEPTLCQCDSSHAAKPAPCTQLVIASADSADGALWEGGPNRTMMASPKHGARLVCTYSNPDAMVIDEFAPEGMFFPALHNLLSGCQYMLLKRALCCCPSCLSLADVEPTNNIVPAPRREPELRNTTALGGAGAAISAPTSAHRVVEHVQAPAPASPAPTARVQPRRGLPQEPTVFQTAHGTLTIMPYAD